MTSIKVTISGTRLILRKLNAIEKFIAPNSPVVNTAMGKIADEFVHKIKRNIVSQRLIDTGHLLRSVRKRKLRTSGGIRYSVGPWRVPYAGLYEYGFTGTLTIKAHIRAGVAVAAHRRHVDVQARPYIRPAARQMQGRVSTVLSKALQDAIK